MTVLFALTVLCAGFGVVRLAGLAKGTVGLGLGPSAGLAVLVIFSSWGAMLGAPPAVTSAAVYGVAVIGLALAVHDRASIFGALSSLARERRGSVATLVAGLAIPFIAMGLSFGGPQVPLSPHDGATHTETVEAFRSGLSWSTWYPPGLAAVFAASLQPFPWIDSALGAVQLGMSLPTLASLAVFGLSMAVWRDFGFAAAGALLLSFTYLYPYFPQLWSGWPLALSLILVMGLWTVALEYMDRPSPRWGVLAGLGLGAVVLVHGSELFTLTIVLPVILTGALRRLVWRTLPIPIAVAVVVALAGAAPYLPNLAGWASAGGAYAAGLADTPMPQSTSVSAGSAPSAFVSFALNAFGIDLPVRLSFLIIGIGWSVRERAGRTVLVVGIVFGAIAVALNAFADVSVLRQIYAATFPWGMHYRLLMLVTIAQVLLAGVGGVVLLRQVRRWADRPNAWGRRLGRLTRILMVTWVGLTASALALFMATPARMVLGYGVDDAAAMAWLREHAQPGEVMLNDGFADAGIWAPYKAGVPILLQRSATLPPEEVSTRTLIWRNVGRLDQAADAAAAACAEHVHYVYYGARTSEWDRRSFPPLDDLRASPALQEVFAQGGAAVFRTRLPCL